ncbi:hypothetical protein [Deinococcus arenicola]|uniref:Protein NO VEIN C-terminal domain-containing protein n=1 Tax=Deinococcus arenicola TaxID=2994950 RepID=A0ABU4DLK6_9DEIO|nr:hypothetical protein [Deinococcus sp. ZS9-10]MDV6373314.1 hypothetical protein [Deinococcus sp. ZS9-10]
MNNIESHFTWSFNQHVGKMGKSEVIYAFITAILNFGRKANYREEITNFIGSQGFLTWNERADSQKADLWRDYQQYLPDLGLIYSTELISKEVVLTPIALMFANGEISFQDLMNTQTLRFQYPNGQKSKMPSWASDAYASKGLSKPSVSAQAYMDYGILIRPGLLLIRCLIELFKYEHNPILTVDEVVAFCLPIKNNSDWHTAVASIINDRASKNRVYHDRTANAVKIRHVSEWFRQLNTTSFCKIERIGASICLSLRHFSENDIQELERVCEQYEDIPFWIPDLSQSERENRLSWFSYYGSIDIDSIIELDTSAYESNGNLQKEDSNIILGNNELLKINEYDYINYVEREYEDVIPNIQNYKSGREKLAEKSILHDKIVFELARHLSVNRYSLSFDPSSADLIAERESERVLFEVKTVTRKKVSQRIRLGIGQVSEYRYRYEMQNKIRPSACIVVSSSIEVAEWYSSYFTNDIKMSLIARTSENEFSTLISEPSFILP